MNGDLKRTVAIAELPGLYEPLTRALAQTGVSIERLEQLLVDSVSLRCIQCGRSTSGSALIALGLPNPEAIAVSPELQRLSEKHCVSEKCLSCFYDVRFSAAEVVDWESIWTATQGIRDERRLKAQAPEGPFLKRIVANHGALPLAVAVVAMMAFSGFVYWHFRTPAWARPVPVYQVDTNGVDAVSGR